MPLWLFWLPLEPLLLEPLLPEPEPPVALLVPLAVEPLALIAPIEPTPVLDAVAPPVLEPVEPVEPAEPVEPVEPLEPVEPGWSLPWFDWLLLFRLPELLELPWLPALLPFASLDF
jgi:hypothetical protein